MAFAEIKTEIQGALARNDTAVTDQIGTWVNRRQRLVALRHNFTFMRSDSMTGGGQATTDGSKTYYLPANYKDDGLFYLHKSTAYVELPVISERAARRTYGPSDEGEPEYVELVPGDTSLSVAGAYRLWPTPDAVYTLRLTYYKWPTDLSDTETTNWFTTNVPGLLVAGGIAEGLRFLGAHEEAVYWEAGRNVDGREVNPSAFEPMLKQAIALDAQQVMPQDLVLVPRWTVWGDAMTARRAAGWGW